jgi:hypothetical protein
MSNTSRSAEHRLLWGALVILMALYVFFPHASDLPECTLRKAALALLNR